MPSQIFVKSLRCTYIILLVLLMSRGNSKILLLIILWIISSSGFFVVVTPWDSKLVYLPWEQIHYPQDDAQRDRTRCILTTCQIKSTIAICIFFLCTFRFGQNMKPRFVGKYLQVFWCDRKWCYMEPVQVSQLNLSSLLF